MLASEIYTVDAMWPSRLETPEELARRILDFLTIMRSTPSSDRIW